MFLTIFHKLKSHIMSLDISLYRIVWKSYDEGKTHEVEKEYVYECNITHNLSKMAEAANIYNALWHPERIGAVKAKEVTHILEKGISEMIKNPDVYMCYDSKNGWGTYKDFIPFLQKYLNALKEYPDAIIETNF